MGDLDNPEEKIECVIKEHYIDPEPKAVHTGAFMDDDEGNIISQLKWYNNLAYQSI